VLVAGRSSEPDAADAAILAEQLHRFDIYVVFDAERQQMLQPRMDSSGRVEFGRAC
jgi:hypothetical protein